MHEQIKHSLAHLQDLIRTLVGVIIYVFYTSQCSLRLNFVDVIENALFVHAFGYTVKLTVTGWCIIAIYIHGYSN